MTGPKRISFKLRVVPNKTVLIHATSSSDIADMDLLVYDLSGNLIASNTQLDKYSRVIFKTPASSYCEVVVIRADYSITPEPCMVAIYEMHGYNTSEEQMIRALTLALYPREITKHLSLPQDCIRPVTLMHDWLVLGFTLAPREAMNIPMRSDLLPTVGSYSALAACDAATADITISIRNRSGDTVETSITGKLPRIIVAWAPRPGEDYTARVVNTGTKETLVLFSQFANDARVIYAIVERLKDTAPPAKGID